MKLKSQIAYLTVLSLTLIFQKTNAQNHRAHVRNANIYGASIYGLLYPFYEIRPNETPLQYTQNMCKPGIPTIQIENVSTPGDCSKVKISFWATDATSYNISCREMVSGQFNSWITDVISDSSLKYTFENLYQNVAYEFRIEAHNKYGGTINTKKVYRASCK